MALEANMQKNVVRGIGILASVAAGILTLPVSQAAQAQTCFMETATGEILNFDALCGSSAPSLQQGIQPSSESVSEPAAAPVPLNRDGRLFIDRFNRYHRNSGINSPLDNLPPDAEAVVADVYVQFAQNHCLGLRSEMPMEFYRMFVDARVSEGNREGVVLLLALFSSAVATYCPEYTTTWTQTFPEWSQTFPD